MKVTTIAYEQLFPTGVYANQRYRAEITLEDDDFEIKTSPDGTFTLPDPTEVAAKAFERAKKIVNDAFEKLNPGIVWDDSSGSGGGKTFIDARELPQNQSPTDKIQSFISTIQLCNTTANLERFRATVEREKNEALTTAFQNKLQSLQNQ